MLIKQFIAMVVSLYYYSASLDSACNKKSREN